MTRRGKGEGTIRKRSDGRWEARYTVGIDSKTGKQLRKSVYGKTKQETREALTAITAALDIGMYFEATKGTLAAWLERWLWEVKRPNIKPKTFDSYRETVATHIADTALGHMKLADIRRHHIQSWIDQKAKDGASAHIVRYAYGIIRNAMNDAVRRGLLPVSFADKVSLPQKTAKPVDILTPEQQKIFTKAISGHRLEAAFYVALTTGLREGEIAALKWSDFDAGAGTLTVSKNAIRIGVYDPDTNEKTGTKVVIQDTPKSRAGHRVFPLLPKTVNAIQRHRIRQLDEKMKNRQLYVDNDLIFANEIGGLYDPKTFYTALRKICKRTPGLEPIKFHALRHTFATRGLEADISGKAMQGLLGHETEAMTLHYQQILEAQARKEIDKLQNAF